MGPQIPAKNSPAPVYGTSRQTSTMPRPPARAQAAPKEVGSAVHVHVSAAASARNAANISSARRGYFFSQSSARPSAAAACTHLSVRDHVARAPHALEREPASVFHAVAPDLTPGSGPWLPWLRDRQVHAGDPGEGPGNGDDSVLSLASVSTLSPPGAAARNSPRPPSRRASAGRSPPAACDTPAGSP